MNEAKSVIQLPPEHLRVRVGASRNPEVFLSMGRSISASIDELLQPMAGKRVLDFGCGCARVLRHLADSHRETIFHGADVDAEAIAWCRKNLGGLARWHDCGESPPLPFSDCSLDYIYLISVFTHLPPAMQIAWLSEFERVVAEDGLIVVSVYNRIINEILPASQRTQLVEEGVLYANDGGTDGLPNSYQSCFHTPEYVRDKWTEQFSIVEWKERAFCNSLDAICLRKRSTLDRSTSSVQNGGAN